MTLVSWKINLPVLILLSLLLTTVSAASLNSSTHITSFGTIKYSGVFVVDFEKNADFEVGEEHAGNYSSPWDRGGWALSNPSIHFVPETSIRHSGSRSAKLWLENPSAPDNPSASYRLELLHDWNATTAVHQWLQVWYYIPEGSPIGSSPAEWVALHRSLYERLWGSDGSYEWWNGFTTSIVYDGRSSRPTYGKPIFDVYTNYGEVDNNEDGRTDPMESVERYPSDTRQHWDSSLKKYVWNNGVPELVPVFGQWFKITTYAYRHLTNGTIMWWLNDELIYNETNIRTIGILPERIEEIGWYHNPDDSMAHFSSGFSLYTEEGSSPKTIFVDDVVLSNSSQISLAPQTLSKSIGLDITGSVPLGAMLIAQSLNFNWDKVARI